MNRNSYFDGGLLDYIGYSLVAWLITVATFGIGAPWGICLMYNWKVKHTVIDGHRHYFDGTATQLFGNWVKWFVLTIITFGIYGFWLHIKLEQWITKHTHLLN
ncbi:Predicted membrane protein [Chlamydia trachomatis]|nr:Predicted membrane protein [Chlamydia trachomatis]CRH89990.1 Predicted membrane protein [Chlamydia trachomatis]